MRKPRLRISVLAGGSLAVLAVLLWTDPDSGISTGMLALSLVTPLVAVGFAHMVRKTLFDYPEADMRTLFTKAGESPEGAGLALVAMAIAIYALLALFGGQVRAQTVATFIPANAPQYLPTLKREQVSNWPDHPRPAMLPALVEQESCISLTHSKCWNPMSRLKSAREEGAGFGQITRAYSADGSLRFDALQEMRERHPALAEWTWANVYQRPDLQLRAVVLKSRDDFLKLGMVQSPMARLAFADAAYNGGLGGVQKERRACGLKDGCNPQQWFGNVELLCLKSKRPLYGNRNACDINREHVRNVMVVRSPKYSRWM